VSRGDAELFRTAGFDAGEGVAWHQHVGPREAVVWRQLGFGPDNCREWLQVDYGASIAALWDNAGFGPGAAETAWRPHTQATAHAPYVPSGRHYDDVISWAINWRGQATPS
jgi:hypothetical protein